MRRSSARILRLRKLVGVASLAALGHAACANPPPIHETPLGHLKREIARDVPGFSASDLVIPHQISEESFQTIHARVGDLADHPNGALSLLRLLYAPDRLGLEYRWGETRSAEETIAQGGGNCLSLAAVLVGAARRYSGAARYIEFQDSPQRREEGDLEVWGSHIAVMIPSINGPIIIDFRGARADRDSTRYRLLSDRNLVAHYYNDKGYDLLRRARERGGNPPWQDAARLFEIATRIDPSLSRAWNNLGVAQARMGDFAGAEFSYEQASNSPGTYLKTATERNRISLDFRRGGPHLEARAWE